MEDRLESNHLGSDIWIYQRAISSDLCRRIIERYDATEEKDQPGSHYDNRECEYIAISARPDWADIDQSLVYVIRRVLCQHYAEYESLKPFDDEGYEVCCYKPGEVARPHSDGTVKPGGGARLWSMVLYLNDCEGGEVVFPRQNIEVKPAAGLGAVWPPHVTHPHYTRPSNDRRFMVVTWTCHSSLPAVISPDQLSGPLTQQARV